MNQDNAPDKARPRIFLAGFLLAAILVAASYLTAATVGVAFPGDTAVTFCQELYVRKDALCHNTPGERVLIVGGSGALFSVRAEMIQAAAGKPTINYATHAGLGAEYILARASRHVRDGDHVILIPEYGLWYREKALDTKGELARKFVMTYDRGFLLERGFPRAALELLRTPTHDLLQARSNITWRRRGANLRDAPHYPVSHLTHTADLSLTAPRMPRKAQLVGAGVQRPEPQHPDWGRSHDRFIQTVADRGASLILTWPACFPRPQSSPVTAQYIPEIERLATALASDRGFPTTERAKDQFLIPQLLGDTPYHTTTLGAVARTWALVEHLPPDLAPPRDGLFLLGWGSTRASTSAHAIQRGAARARWLLARDERLNPGAVSTASLDDIAQRLERASPIYFDDPALIPALADAGFGSESLDRPTTQLTDLRAAFPNHILAIVSSSPDTLTAPLDAPLDADLPPGHDRLALLIGTGNQQPLRLAKSGAGSASLTRHLNLTTSAGDALPVRLDLSAADALTCQFERSPAFQDLQREGTRVLVLDPQTGLITARLSYDADQRPIEPPLFRVTDRPPQVESQPIPLASLTPAGQAPPTLIPGADHVRVRFAAGDSAVGVRLSDLPLAPGRAWLKLSVTLDEADWVNARLISTAANAFARDQQTYRVPLPAGSTDVLIPFQINSDDPAAAGLVAIARDRRAPSTLTIDRVQLLRFLFLFLPACIVAVLTARRLFGPSTALAVLLAASLFFYAHWDWRYLALFIPSIAFNYAIGRRLASNPSRALLALGVSLNLALIAVFKYADLIASIGTSIAGAEPTHFGIVLPLGISFFTFQQIAYLCDCRASGVSERSPLRYGLFVAFFPQLIAGPIVHHKEILPQLCDTRTTRWDWARFSSGLAWLSIGLFKKVAIADTLSPWVNTVFDATAPLTMEQAWFGSIAYTFQLYFDFSGYSDMAIGLALFFGVRLPENFNAPYRATSIVEFWRRWHMTLSRFLRDYLYFPLGGNRKGPLRRYLNLFITMLLGGLWHGSGWTFVIWGGYHGILLCVNHAWERYGFRLPMPAARALTLLAALCGWVVFRSTDFDSARRVLSAMVGAGAQSAPLPAPSPWQWALLAALLALTQLAPTTTTFLTRRAHGFLTGLAVGALFCIAMLLLKDVYLSNTRVTEFIYFQF
eukprot:g5609.t1